MMKVVNRIFTAAAVGLMFSPGLASMSQAESVDTPLRTGTLNEANDLTIDTNTGLEFLDIDTTANQSFNQTQDSTFVTDQGFRVATFNEFQQLLTDAGFTNFSGDFNTEDQAAAENLLDNFIGETIPPGEEFVLGGEGGTPISDGFYAYVTDSPFNNEDQVNVTGVDYQSADLGQAPQDQARITLSLNQFGKDFTSPIAGSLLVRESATSIPTPSSVLLGLVGLGMLGLQRRRRGQSPVS